MRTVSDDVDDYERNQQQIALLKAANPKVERIRARRDIKVARASGMTEDARIARYIAAVVAVALMSSAGCSVMVWGHPNPAKDQQIHEEKMACIAKHGKWTYDACHF